MSPLACSLFVLAAMVATAHSYCTTKHAGRRTMYPVDYEQIYFNPPGVKIHADQNNCPYGMHVVGEDVVACNNDAYGPAPEVHGVNEGQFSRFTVRCSVYECRSGGNINLMQYCGY